VQIYITRLQMFSDALTAENKNVISFAAKVQTVQFNIRSSGGRLFHTCTWASHCEVPGADGSTSPWNVPGSGVGGPQRTSTSHGRHKDAVVSEVGRCQAVEALENNQRQFEQHTLYHEQPMEFVRWFRSPFLPSFSFSLPFPFHFFPPRPFFSLPFTFPSLPPSFPPPKI